MTTGRAALPRRGVALAALAAALAVASPAARGAPARGAAPAPPPPAGSAPAAARAPSTLDLVVSGFNPTYSRPGAAMAPVARGPLTLRLTAPENTVVVTENRLRLARLDDGTDRVDGSAEFAGRARIVADYELAGVPGRLEDEVTVPRQSRAIAGRVRLARADGDEGGYAVTIVELPPTVEVRIESRLAGQLGAVCDALSILPLVALDCDAIRGALATASVPLPKAGEIYFLPDSRLTPAERRLLDAYLGGRR
jgi:hypothetical protein